MTDAVLWVLILLVIIIMAFILASLAYYLNPLLDKWLDMLDRLHKKGKGK